MDMSPPILPGSLKVLMGSSAHPQAILEHLRDDLVVLVQRISPPEADILLEKVSTLLEIRDKLELQSAFASINGHRYNVGKNFMSVNERSDYQFITAHSEGTRDVGMQLASFYCYENSTDGGHTILFNINSSSSEWLKTRESSIKIDLCGKTLSAAEIAAARGRFQIFIPSGILRSDHHILNEINSSIPGTRLFNVLSTPSELYSTIASSNVLAYWDNIGSTDLDAAKGYVAILRSLDLLRTPQSGLNIKQMDNAHSRRTWRSGIDYSALFKGMIVRKLEPGDLVIQNNLTWAHSVSNWTPGSGTRRVVAAFA